MVGASKILTVSYGTFSCTLEGFDEPFSTMKAIAEYFRDLAADDRYFGAEPPTPDPEMLHRIAEREIHRRVEARVNEHGLILRQTEPTPAPVATPTVTTPTVATPTVATPAPAPAPVAAPTPAVAPALVAAEPVVESAPVEIAPVEAAPVEAAPVEVAQAETAQAEAEVAEVATAMISEPETVTEIAEEETEEAPAPAVAEEHPVEALATEEPVAEAQAVEVSVAEEQIAEEPAAEAEAEPYEISLDAIMAAAAADMPAAEDMSAPALSIESMDEAEAPAEDSIAAKLMRIRAVVDDVRAGRAAAYEDEEGEDVAASAPQTDEDFAFDLDLDDGLGHAAPAAAAAQEESSADDIIARLTGGAGAVDGAESEPVVAEETYDEPVAENVAMPDMAELTQEEPVADDTPLDAPMAAQPAFDDSYLDEEDEEDDDQPHSELSRMVAAAEAEVAEDATSSFDGHEDIQVSIPPIDDAGTREEPPAERHPSFFERARARVSRLGRSAAHADEPEAVAGNHAHDEYDDADYDANVAAEVEDEFADVAHPLDPAAAAGARALLETRAEEADDFPRLMEEAKSKLEGAESRRKFSAISHLKAAVAATLADRQVQPGEQAAAAQHSANEEISLYRDDLSKAVRPRRPVSEGTTTRRPAVALRPAPLVLVSEQRIDVPAEGIGEGAVIRPRRVAAGNLAIQVEEDADEVAELDDVTHESVSNFAEFADRVGASTLIELLEAAAVYTSAVEGREAFSRPQLLRKVEFVSSRGDFNHEEGLRSFGLLLRQGKIQKVAQGRFTIADKSQFRA